MSKDLTVFLGDHPGSLAKVGEALGKAGVNIEGICGVTVQGKGVIHVLVADASKARRALEANHIDVVKETDVVVLTVEDRPGALGNVARRLANAGVNLQLAYLATSTRLVVGADDLEKVRAALEAKKLP
ncbi:MAG: amino acid-binding protein [candidate division NC10 bacterium RBG_16_65_8]|nr:MAG: amino acid-binding protein [candidate division NC10 bacterium RBG_16_65_8]